METLNSPVAILPPPPEDVSRRGRPWIPIALLVSAAVHLICLWVVTHAPLRDSASDKIAENHPLEITLAPSRQVVDTPQETAKEKPTDAKFESDRNLKAIEDTSPATAPLSLPHQGGVMAPKVTPSKSASPKEAKKNTTTLEKSENVPNLKEHKKIFSITQNDMKATGELDQATLSQNRDPGVTSTGFLERLKRGQEFKVSAQESDYGQYINRMRQKLITRWSPQKFIRAAWYTKDQVGVQLGVVLDKQGQVVDIRNLASSSFSDYDEEAIRAIKDGSPYPNPPRSLIQDDGFVYMPWNFVLYMSSVGYASKGVD